MMNTGAVEPQEMDGEEPPWRVYRAISGSLVVDPAFVHRMGRAAFLTRLVYNAATDDRVPFAEGFAYRYSLAEARRAGTEEPAEPGKSERFLPVPNRYALGLDLTLLRARFPALAEFPRSMFVNALVEACTARRKHVEACAKSKAAGGKLPRLSYRRADDAWSVSTDDFMLLRIGTDHAQRPAKTQKVTATTRRNRARRATEKLAREEAWAENKKRSGWSEARIAAGRERRKARQDRDRDWQRALQVWRADEVKEKRVRRDSPKATVGANRLKADIVGLGRVRLDLGMEIPEGAEKVRLTLVKPAWRGAKVECRLTYTVPEQKPDLDPVETGRRLHEALRHLPPDATRLDAVEAVRAAGIVVRGQDLGIANPSCDDRGVTTPPVRMPMLDIQALRRAQMSLSWKDRCRKEGSNLKPSKKDRKAARPKGQAFVAIPSPPAVTDGAATIAEGQAVERKARTRPRRSAAAERERAIVTRINHKAANRQLTRAHQDAALLMRDRPVLVATDPTRMVKPILAKDGPAERLARRLAFEAAPAALVAGYVLSQKRQRAMRRNLHATRFGERIRRVGILSERLGAIHCMPGHEGTTACCPACPRVRKKDLGERWHDCPCGLRLPRDQASALEAAGRALLPFRKSSDPGGLIAQAIAERAEARAEALAKRARLTEASRAAAVRRRGTNEDGRGVPRHPGRGASGPLEAKPKRVRGQGRNVRRSAGQATGFSD